MVQDLYPYPLAKSWMRACQGNNWMFYVFRQFREKLSLGDFMARFWVQVTNRAFFFIMTLFNGGTGRLKFMTSYDAPKLAYLANGLG